MHIVLADPLPLVRSGLQQALSPLSRSVQFIEADDLEALRQVLSEAPKLDLAVVDASLPGSADHHDLCRLAVQRGVKLALTLAVEDAALAVDILGRGAAGVILKRSPGPVILAALQVLLAGGRFISPEVFLSAHFPPDCRACAAGFLAARTGSVPRSRRSDLTPRQRQVMDLMSEGLSNKEIGRRLRLTEGTVKVRVARILDSMDVSSRMKAVAKARQSATKAARDHK